MRKVNRRNPRKGGAQRRVTRLVLLSALCAGALPWMPVIAPQAHAAEVSIVAEYVAGTQTSASQGFRHVTRSASVCAADTGACLDQSTVDFPVGDVSYGALAAGMTGQDAVYFRGPSQPVRIALKDERTNRTAVVTFRVTGVLGQYLLHSDIQKLTGVSAGNVEAAHAALWEGGSWQMAPAGCTALGMQPTVTERSYRFGWRLPREGGGCFKAPRQALPAGAIVLDGSSFGLAYELVTPDPTTLPNGIYRAVQTLTIGPGRDIDFGQQARAGRSTMDVEFVLKVRHQFMLTDAGAGNDVSLAPPRGWESWVAEGRPSLRIDQDVAFGLTTGEPLKVSLRCEDGQNALGQCLIRNTQHSAVPVGVALTVAGASTETNAPFSRVPLSTQTPVALAVDRYLDNTAATAHIRVDSENVAEMGRHPGTTYAGRLSIVFDALAE